MNIFFPLSICWQLGNKEAAGGIEEAIPRRSRGAHSLLREPSHAADRLAQPAHLQQLRPPQAAAAATTTSSSSSSRPQFNFSENQRKRRDSQLTK